MKKYLSALALACMLSLTVFTSAAFADDLAAASAAPTGSSLQTTASNVIECNVLDYGAVPNDDISDSDAINRALRTARQVESDTTVHVVVPKGEYHLGEPLRMYSNTTLTLDENAKIVADYGNQEMLNGLHMDPTTGSNCTGLKCTHGGYSQLSNITIEGGTWEGMQGTKSKIVGNMSIFMLRHGHDITIRNTTVKYAATHFFNLASTQNVLVENVTFKDAQEVTDPKAGFWGEVGQKYGSMGAYNAVEAVHLDTCDGVGEAGEGAMPLDCTPCNNVTVQNCTFDNVWSGVGNHHPAKVKNKRSSEIKVLDNTFKNIRYYALYALDFDNITLQGNTITNASGITSLRGCTNSTISKNTLTLGKKNVGKYNLKSVEKDKRLPSVLLVNCKTFDVLNNSVSNSPYRGIRVQDCSNMNVKSNKVPNAAEKGIYVTGTAKCIIESNTVKSPGDLGIQIDSGSGATVKKNTVSGSKATGIGVAKCDVTIENNTVSYAKANSIMANGSKCIISNNKLSNSKGIGIRVIGGQATIKDNTLTSPGKRAIHVDAKCKKLQIVSNKMSKTSENGIVIQNCFGVTVSKNNLSNVKGVGLRVMGGQVTISNNELISMGARAMQIDGNCKKLKVLSNTVTKTTQHGIVVGNCSGSTISKNKVSGVPERGISINDSVKVQAVGNVVTSEGDSMYIAGTSKKKCCTVTVKNNTLSSKELHDLKLGLFALNCYISGNTLKHNSFYCAPVNASYTGTV